MAEQPKEQTEQGAAETKKKKKPLGLVIVAVLMIAEAAAVFLVVSKTSGASSVQAAEIEGQGDHLHATVELPVIKGHFQNLTTGRVWDWETEIFLKVSEAHAEHVGAELEKRKAEISDGIAKIYRQAQHSHLREPGLQTLTRQVSAYLDKTLGKDPEGHAQFERVLIPKCDGYPAEF